MSNLYNLAKDLIRKESYFEVGTILEDLFKIKHDHEIITLITREEHNGVFSFNRRFYHDHLIEETDNMIKRSYMRKLHNSNGPARYVNNESRLIIQWISYNKLHRIGGPASVSYSSISNTIKEQWYINDVNYNPDGPAEVRRRGKMIVHEVYRDKKGREHRDKGPAVIWCNINGIKMEIYYKHGKRHRIDGPALIQRNQHGDIIKEEYYLDDVQQYE